MKYEELPKDLIEELEPGANEVVFGQKTLPDRPLTNKEMSKRKRVLLKLVDQNLKLKLIELMKKVADEQSEASTTAFTPVFDHTNIGDSPSVDSSTVSPIYQYVQSLPRHSQFGLQYPEAEPKWQSQFSEWRSTLYPHQHETNSEHQDDSLEHNMQHCPQNLNAKKSLNRNLQQNAKLLHPVMDATQNIKPKSKTGNDSIHKAKKSSTATTCMDDQSKFEEEKLDEKVNCKQITQGRGLKRYQNNSLVTPISRLSTKKRLLSTERISQLSNVIPLTNSDEKRAIEKNPELIDGGGWVRPAKDPICEQIAHFPAQTNLIEFQNVASFKCSSLQPLRKRGKKRKKQSKREKKRMELKQITSTGANSDTVAVNGHNQSNKNISFE